MFFKKEDIKAKIKGIILDERDNDIVFILAAKGMGKINLLSEIYDSESANEDIIIADGKRVRNASSCLSKCYIDGIFKYIEKDNTRETKKRFIQQLPKKKISMKRRIAFLQSIEKIGISEFSLWLSDLSPRELKEIYISVAGETLQLIFQRLKRTCDEVKTKQLTCLIPIIGSILFSIGKNMLLIWIKSSKELNVRTLGSLI